MSKCTEHVDHDHPLDAGWLRAADLARSRRRVAAVVTADRDDRLDSLRRQNQ